MSNEPEPVETELSYTIREWARYTIWALQKEIVKKKIGATGSLLRSFEHNVKFGAGGSVSGVTIGFWYHGKFVDMGVGKGVKLENVKGNAEVWRSLASDERQGRKNRKPKKWYSPTMYYEYQRLAELLRDKYALSIPARLEYTLSERIEIKL